MMISGIGSILGILGRYPEAAERFSRLIAIDKTALDVQQESIPAAIANLGWTQFHQRKFSEAKTTLREALRGYKNIKSETWERYNTESMLGAVLVATGEYDEAAKHLMNSYDKLLEPPPARRPAAGFTAESEPGERIVSLYQCWGKPGKVAEWRNRIIQSKTTASKNPS
jgi:tetratricopeptide (TPR) repeat protein